MKDNFTKFTALKRSWKYCPRCNVKAVNKDMRRCDACKGRLYFNGDSLDKSITEREGFYVWYRSEFSNIWGWYYQSYFIGEIAYDVKR